LNKPRLWSPPKVTSSAVNLEIEHPLKRMTPIEYVKSIFPKGFPLKFGAKPSKHTLKYKPTKKQFFKKKNKNTSHFSKKKNLHNRKFIKKVFFKKKKFKSRRHVDFFFKKSKYYWQSFSIFLKNMMTIKKFMSFGYARLRKRELKAVIKKITSHITRSTDAKLKYVLAITHTAQASLKEIHWLPPYAYKFLYIFINRGMILLNHKQMWYPATFLKPGDKLEVVNILWKAYVIKSINYYLKVNKKAVKKQKEFRFFKTRKALIKKRQKKRHRRMQKKMVRRIAKRRYLINLLKKIGLAQKSLKHFTRSQNYILNKKRSRKIPFLQEKMLKRIRLYEKQNRDFWAQKRIFYDVKGIRTHAKRFLKFSFKKELSLKQRIERYKRKEIKKLKNLFKKILILEYPSLRRKIIIGLTDFFNFQLRVRAKKFKIKRLAQILLIFCIRYYFTAIAERRMFVMERFIRFLATTIKLEESTCLAYVSNHLNLFRQRFFEKYANLSAKFTEFRPMKKWIKKRRLMRRPSFWEVDFQTRTAFLLRPQTVSQIKLLHFKKSFIPDFFNHYNKVRY
jgi:hypothetical protein